MLLDPDAEEHVQEVGRVGEFVLRVHVGKAAMVPVGEGRQRGKLPDQAHDLLPPALGGTHLLRPRVEGGERRHRADHHPHGVRVVAELVHEVGDVLVDVGVKGHVVDEVVELRPGRKLPLQNEMGDLQKGASLGEFLDRIPPVLEDPLRPIDVGDGAAGGGGVGEARIVRHHPEIVVFHPDSAQIHGTDHIAVEDIDLVAAPGAVVGDRQRVPGLVSVLRHFLPP